MGVEGVGEVVVVVEEVRWGEDVNNCDFDENFDDVDENLEKIDVVRSVEIE